MIVEHASNPIEARPLTVRAMRRRRGRDRRKLHRRLAPRLHAEELVRAARHLSQRDRALVAAVYERGLALKAVAIINNTQVSRLHRRLVRIVERLRSPLFRMVLREHARWPPDRRAIAEAIVLRGEPQREIADMLGVSLHEVRMELAHLKALAGVSREAEETGLRAED